MKRFFMVLSGVVMLLFYVLFLRDSKNSLNYKSFIGSLIAGESFEDVKSEIVKNKAEVESGKSKIQSLQDSIRAKKETVFKAESFKDADSKLDHLGY